MSTEDPLKTKQSFYFPADLLEEIRAEAKRLDRSMSWLVQRAWKLSKKAISEMPADPPTT